MDIQVGNAGMNWHFNVMSGDVYTVSGTISEPDGTPIEHVKVSLVDHQAGIGYDTDTDEFGAYSVIAPAGTYDFNAWPDDPELGGYWTSGFDLSANMPDYDLVLAPQVYVDYDGDHFLGQKGNGATVEVTFELRNNADEEVPGLGDQFEVWIHDWDNDPDQNSWWDNPVNNLYHWDVTDLVTITEGSYTLEYIVDGSLPIFNSEGHRNLEIRIGNAGYGWGFRYISGEVYTISGVVQDSTGAPVENVWVNLWTEEDVYGVDTDDLGRFSISAPSGTYELSAWPDDSELSGHWEPKFDLNDDSAGMVITLFEEVWFDYAGNWNLGTYAAGETVSVTFELRDNNNNPVSGLSDSFVIWMHDWDGDPNPHEWWTNPVSNNYHWEVTDDVTIIEGSYTLEYVIDNTKPVFAAGGERRFQVNLGFYQLEWDFYYSSGGQYTLSGVVTDSFGAPVDGAMVELMGQEDEYNTFTNQFGQYILDVSDGQYELLVVPLDHSVLSAYFDMGLTINDDLQQDIELESIVAGVSLTGGVYDVTFTPIEGAEVVLLDGTTMYYSVTNVLGEYSILAPSGTYERLMVMPPEEPAYEDYAMLSFTRYELLETQVQNVYLMIGPPDEPI